MYMEKLSVRFFLRPAAAAFFLEGVLRGMVVVGVVVICVGLVGAPGPGARPYLCLLAQQRACMREIESRLQATAKSMGASPNAMCL